MDAANLQAFVTVVELGSFSRAAERLFLTQPAVSKRIRALEYDLGVALLDRLGREVLPTEPGRVLLASARRILADIAASREEIHALDRAVGGRLRLGTSHHVGIHRLPPVLRGFVQRYPEVELDLVFLDSELAAADVLDGALELAIVTLPEQEDARLDTRLVWHDPLALVAAADHPLVSIDPLTPERLAEHSAVLPGRGTITRRILFDTLAPYGLDVRTSLETNYLETIKMMVSVGLGWSALPATMLDDSVRALVLPGLDMSRRLGVVRLKQRTLGRAAQALLDLLPIDPAHD